VAIAAQGVSQMADQLDVSGGAPGTASESSVAVVVNYVGSSGATVFTILILMTGITAAIPYGFSALAQMSGAGSTTGRCRPRALPAT
jgi:hypothetical protein